MGMQDSLLESYQSLRPAQIADLRLAASKMTGPTRRAFQAEMALKYCGGNSLLAETIFGWGRHGFDHGIGHPLLLLYDAKTPRVQKVKEFNDLGDDPFNTSASLF